MKRIGLASVALAVALLTTAGTALAESTTTICIPTSAGKPLVSGEAGGCKNTKTVTYNALNLPGSGGLETLNKVLPHVTYSESGIGGKPTIQFSGINVQVVSGAGKTNAAVNGEGNLVIGYDENSGNSGAKNRACRRARTTWYSAKNRNSQAMLASSGASKTLSPPRSLR